MRFLIARGPPRNAQSLYTAAPDVARIGRFVCHGFFGITVLLDAQLIGLRMLQVIEIEVTRGNQRHA